MRRIAVALVALLALTAQAPHSYVGVQVLTVIGVHRDVAGSQSGVGAGPLLQARLGGRRFAAQIEGIPVVGIPRQGSSAAYGQATPSIGIFNGEVLAAVDRDAKLWFGLGETIYNQRTPLPAQSQVVSSRLAGLRYALSYHGQTRGTHFIEAFLGAAPMLSGTDHYVSSIGAANVDKPERASEIDASLAFGWQRNASQWLVGVRTLNFAARFIKTGEAADRNVGIGPLVEWRHLFP
ncbi:MAG: hypothetical protein KGN02_04335 [bacterium]|nr:hypothetical protein [bacterium]